MGFCMISTLEETTLCTLGEIIPLYQSPLGAFHGTSPKHVRVDTVLTSTTYSKTADKTNNIMSCDIFMHAMAA